MELKKGYQTRTLKFESIFQEKMPVFKLKVSMPIHLNSMLLDTCGNDIIWSFYSPRQKPLTLVLDIKTQVIKISKNSEILLEKDLSQIPEDKKFHLLIEEITENYFCTIHEEDKQES